MLAPGVAQGFAKVALGGGLVHELLRYARDEGARERS
jgi:hypothetical protein